MTRDIILEPIVADEIAAGVHRTAITWGGPITTTEAVQLRQRDGPVIAKATVDLAIAPLVGHIRRHEAVKEIGRDAYPTIETPDDLLTRIPADVDGIDDPRINNHRDNQLRMYRLRNVRPVVTDGVGTDQLDDDELEQIRSDPVLTVEDVRAISSCSVLHLQRRRALTSRGTACHTFRSGT